MLDKLEIRAPVKDEFLFISQRGGYEVNTDYLPDGFTRYQEKVKFAGDYHYGEEHVKWSTIKSSHSGMAYHLDLRTMPPPNRTECPKPSIRFKCSPQKLILGQNSYGDVSMREGATFMFNLLFKTHPGLRDFIDWSDAEIAAMDINKTAMVRKPEDKATVISMLQNCSVGQRRVSKTFNQHAVKWNKNPFCGVTYDKSEELNQPDQRNCKNLIIEQGNLEFVQRMLRFEAKIRTDKLWALGHYTNLKWWLDQSDHYIETQLNKIWFEFYKDIISAVKGMSMQKLDDEWVINSLRETYAYPHHKSGNMIYSKADRLFGFYKMVCDGGYTSVDWSVSRNKRARADLIGAGVPLIHLQNMVAGSANTKVVFLKDLVELSFSDPLPENYVNPLRA